MTFTPVLGEQYYCLAHSGDGWGTDRGTLRIIHTNLYGTHEYILDPGGSVPYYCVLRIYLTETEAELSCALRQFIWCAYTERLYT